MVERGGLTREQGGLDEPWPVGDHDFEVLGVVEHRGGHRPTLWPNCAVTDQDAVKAGIIVGFGDIDQVAGVDHRPVGPVRDRPVHEGPLRLGRIPGPHHPDDLDRHSPSRSNI